MTCGATAADAAGNVGETSVPLDVADRTDVDHPVVNITSPAYGEQITGPVDVTGTVTDDSLVFYSLSYTPLAGGEFVEVARGSSPVTDGVLGTFDPSVLANDTYICNCLPGMQAATRRPNRCLSKLPAS